MSTAITRQHIVFSLPRPLCAGRASAREWGRLPRESALGPIVRLGTDITRGPPRGYSNRLDTEFPAFVTLNRDRDPSRNSLPAGEQRDCVALAFDYGCLTQKVLSPSKHSERNTSHGRAVPALPSVPGDKRLAWAPCVTRNALAISDIRSWLPAGRRLLNISDVGRHPRRHAPGIGLLECPPGLALRIRGHRVHPRMGRPLRLHYATAALGRRLLHAGCGST